MTMAVPPLFVSASQTAAPYLHIGMAPASAGLAAREREPRNVLAADGAHGERIRIEGYILDGEGCPVWDALIEIWQANAHGRYYHPRDDQERPLDPRFTGFGRAVADFETGLWWFETVKPSVVTGRHGRPMAPHVNAIVFARGINMVLHTRIHFGDEAEANAADPVLDLIELAPRRETLVAARQERDGRAVYRLDIHLQGERETVFFDV
jgi:protocatechuate 3,4-dioxygenase alpha subunit